MQREIAPSILSANFASLEKDIQSVTNEGISMIHVDVMDGHFVPNITIGPPVVKSIRAVTKVFLDVHLMLKRPQDYIEAFAGAGANLLSVHKESDHDLLETIRLIKSFGIKAGIALNPDSDADFLKPYLKEIDLVLVMTVFPGFGGQTFIETVLPKITQVREMIEQTNSAVDLEVDGGINAETARLAAKAGANVFVAGNYIFGASDRKKAIEQLKNSFAN